MADTPAKMFAPLRGGRSTTSAQSAEDWTVVAPVPENARAVPLSHPKKGEPTATWTYRAADGRLLGYVWRFDGDGREKEFVPVCWCVRKPGRGAEWRFKSWPAPRPIYGLDRLAAAPSAPVLVTEGEKAADAAQQLLPDWVVVTSPNGSKAAKKADWSILKDRQVTIWPDADDAGATYASDVASMLAGHGVTAQVISLPSGVAVGWDAADARAEGWTEARARELLAQAKPADGTSAAGARADSQADAGNGGRSGRGNASQRDLLLGFLDGIELWHSPTRDAYATIAVNGHMENHQIRSDQFKHWLVYSYLSRAGGAPSRAAIDETVSTLEAMAIHEARRHVPALRYGESSGRLYVDLGDDRWRAVEIDTAGWRVVDRPPVKFLRSPSMRELPQPVADDSGLSLLRSFVNVASFEGDAGFKMLCAWLIGAMMPAGPFPLLLINGEQGSAKSTTTRMLQELVDPSHLRGRALPREERELFIATRHSRALFFDNVSSLPKEMSDALARLSTGGGFAVRRLHSNDEEEIFTATAPVCLNGIPEFVTRADLLDRVIMVTLEAIPEESRRTETELWTEFNRSRPMILGHLYDAVSAALRRRTVVDVRAKTRMADFEVWVSAAEPALGWEDGEFSRLYRDARRGAFAMTVEDDPVAAAVVRLMEKRGLPRWEGTATELLGELHTVAQEAERQSRSWPTGAQRMSEAITRAAPALRHAGIRVAKSREKSEKRRRLITLDRAAPPSDGKRPPF